MRVLAHHADRQLIGDPVIDAQADSASGEVVAIRIRIAVHIDEVTEASHPHAPAIFRSGLENRFHDSFEDFPSTSGFVLQIRRGAVDLHVGAEPVDPFGDRPAGLPDSIVGCWRSKS